jgi:putative transposase
MPKGLKRFYGQAHLHFLTFSCYRRLPLLASVRARNLFAKGLGKAREDYGFQLIGYVVMPNHVHLLLSELRRVTPSTELQMLKQRVSRKMRKKRRPVAKKQLRMAFSQMSEDLPKFWQPRFYDFNVYSRKKLKEKLE